jgi:predicted nucleic acid-binding protein
MLAFDAVLAAVALARGAEALVSADRAFASVPGLTWIDPAAPDVNPYLGD